MKKKGHKYYRVYISGEEQPGAFSYQEARILVLELRLREQEMLTADLAANLTHIVSVNMKGK